METILFVPAHDERKIKSAQALKKANLFSLQLVYDLEDSVPEEYKTVALKNVNLYATQEDWVRVMPKLCRFTDFDRPLGGYMIPKVESTKDLEFWTYDHESYEYKFTCIALIETAKGVEYARRIAKKADAVMFGKADLAHTMGSDLYEDFARKRVVLACKALGKKVYNTPCCSLNEEVIGKHFQETYDLGFDGVGILHPKEIRLVGKYCGPSLKQREYANRVLDMFEKEYVAVVDGNVIGPPVVKRAKQILGKI